MRPVRLDIDGFAAFREPASVVFADVDYFALVGNTGSGKSTIIDALCFALYGTAPRWGRANAVSDALAPTANRAVVSLVFDIGGERYQVVREVRRSGQSVTTKQARLERILDASLVPAPGDDVETEVLVSDVRSLTGAVEALLGLEFAEFCQCVVLPQGEFARFLKATSGERQAILLKLLGAESYKRMQKSATARAKQAETQAEVLSSQLAGKNASPQAQEEATARVAELTAAAARARELATAHVRASTEAEAAAARVARAEDGVAVLGQVVVPDGLAARNEAVVTARRALAAAHAEETRTEAALNAATDRARSTPTRPSLERVAADRNRYREVEEEREAAAARLAGLEEAQTTARGAHEEARASEQEAARADQLAQTRRLEADATHAELTATAQALASLTMPSGLTEAAGALTRVRSAREVATARLATLDEELGAQRSAVAAMPDRRAIDDLEARCAQLDDLAADGEAAATRARARESALEEARGALQRGQQREHAAGEALAAARVQASATALRSGLGVEDTCPVCTHRIDADLIAGWEPGPDDSSLAELSAAAQRARADLDELRERAARVQNELTGAEQEQRSVREQYDYRHRELRERLRRMAEACALAELTLAPQATTSDLRAAAAAIGSAAAHAATGVSELEQELTTLRAEVSDLEATEAKAEGHLRTAELDLVATRTRWAEHGAPDSRADVATGWQQLLDWASERAEDLRTSQIPAAAADQQRAVAAAESSAAALLRAQRLRLEAETHWQELQREHAALRATIDALDATLADLTRVLATAPSAEEVPALLEQADQVAEALAVAEREHRERREARRAAEEQATLARQATDEDREALSTLRDRAAGWQPPAFTPTQLEDDIARAWDEMVAWSGTTAAQARDLLRTAGAELGTHRARLDEIATEVSALVRGTALELPQTASPAEVREAVAVALTRAQGEALAVEKELAAAADLVAQIDETTERARVAAELASLLRADKFQQWLAGAALDTLVAGASASLEQLSEGRFSLTHDKGDFFVLDHFDADSRRSVKTLSGGETFQTSLALALALSEQLAALASGGSARLESIFLDEGFGTLDPESLETVAGTLENLASGKRMVGVVTHVAALAERIPVRFLVTSDNRTSRVEREGD